MEGAIMLNLSEFNWLGGEHVWMRPGLPGPRLEIVIAGDESGPQATRLPLVEPVLAEIASVERKASGYLDVFVHRPKFAPTSDWYLDNIDFGRGASDALDEFTAYFSIEEDLYGLWSVRMRHTQHAGIVPKAFTRRQR